MEQNKQFEDAINSITTAKENLATAKYVSLYLCSE